MPPDTRDRIVAAAMDLFLRKGYGSTSISDVLQTAGVNSGSLYHFFPGKQDVLLAVLAAYQDGIRELLLEPAWKNVEDPVERIFALLACYRNAIVQTDCAYGCPIGILAMELHEPDPPVRKKVAGNFDAWVEAIVECLEAAGPRVPPNLDKRALAEFTLTTMEGGVMLARTWRNVVHFDRAVAQLRAYFDLILKPPRSGRARAPRTPKKHT